MSYTKQNVGQKWPEVSYKMINVGQKSREVSYKEVSYTKQNVGQKWPEVSYKMINVGQNQDADNKNVLQNDKCRTKMGQKPRKTAIFERNIQYAKYLLKYITMRVNSTLVYIHSVNFCLINLI